jgi:hypothetical protein
VERIRARFGGDRNHQRTAQALLGLEGIRLDRHFLHGFRIDAQIGRAVGDVRRDAEAVNIVSVTAGAGAVGAHIGEILRVEVIGGAVQAGHARRQRQQREDAVIQQRQVADLLLLHGELLPRFGRVERPGLGRDAHGFTGRLHLERDVQVARLACAEAQRNRGRAKAGGFHPYFVIAGRQRAEAVKAGAICHGLRGNASARIGEPHLCIGHGRRRRVQYRAVHR